MNAQKESFSEDVIKKLKEKKKGSEYYMETMLVKRMKREAKENIAKGMLENLTAIIKNMLKYNEDDETIMKYTNAKKEDIDRVRKELGIQDN